MKVATDGPKLSKYVQAGLPLACFLPSCRKPFDQSCVRGNGDHYYCSFYCADAAKNIDLTRVEELRPKTVPALPSPKQIAIGRP